MKKSSITCLLLTGFVNLAMAQVSYPNDSPNADQLRPMDRPTERSTASEGATITPSDSIDSRNLSRGGFFIEPMILATQEDETIKTSQISFINDDTSGKSNGFGLGIRAGGHVGEILLLGVDARYARTKMDDSFYQKADGNVYSLAPTVAVQTPYFGVRLLASYVVAGENDPEAGYRGLDLKFKEASGFRVGAGLFIAAVSVNLEYQDITYNRTEIQSIGSNILNNSTSIDANNRGYSLSLSFPVEM